jgi:hypothetical protein
MYTPCRNLLPAPTVQVTRMLTMAMHKGYDDMLVPRLPCATTFMLACD